LISFIINEKEGLICKESRCRLKPFVQLAKNRGVFLGNDQERGWALENASVDFPEILTRSGQRNPLVADFRLTNSSWLVPRQFTLKAILGLCTQRLMDA
jgi:hypothetical protein